MDENEFNKYGWKYEEIAQKTKKRFSSEKYFGKNFKIQTEVSYDTKLIYMIQKMADMIPKSMIQNGWHMIFGDRLVESMIVTSWPYFEVKLSFSANNLVAWKWQERWA